ncbi:hypothetical protein [Roseovarius atlanticus]|uniref:hypothetical protein n=1 Tax=Roseovarius atlanticus TaxID=1641875 RepID=UPI000708ED83|nr:hypothetical protein [Roseovarius atlanticus]
MSKYTIKFSCTFDFIDEWYAYEAVKLHKYLREVDDPSLDMFSFDVSILERDDLSAVIWLRDSAGQADIGAVIHFMHRFCFDFEFKGAWGFQYSRVCSTGRADEYGGGAILFEMKSGRVIAWNSTQGWLQNAIQEQTAISTPAAFY